MFWATGTPLGPLRNCEFMVHKCCRYFERERDRNGIAIIINVVEIERKREREIKRWTKRERERGRERERHVDLSHIHGDRQGHVQHRDVILG